MYRPGHCRYTVGVLTGFVFVGHVWCLCAFCGPSSCVSAGVAGVRGGQATQCVCVYCVISDQQYIQKL
jgi:hypothetical protein